MNKRVLITVLTAIATMHFVTGCKDSSSGPQPPPNGPDTTRHSISWQTDSTGEYPSRLLDVWGTSPSGVYAVGCLFYPPPALGRYVAHFDGTRWTAIQDDSLSWWLAAGWLAGVQGISDSMIFVVGQRDNGPPPTGFAGQWNGRRWVNISPDSAQPLLSVWARSSTDAYACGANGIVLHYDGVRWTSLQSGTNLHIWQITGLPDGEVYAVASDYFNSLLGSVVLRIEGNTVTQDQFFPVGQKFGIWGTTHGELYATGEGTFHKVNGSAWQEIPTPNPRVAMWSVTGTASNNVLVAGSYGAVIHWSGKSWKFYDELYDRSSSKSYFTAFAIGNKYFLVGNTPSQALVTIGTRSE